MRSNSDVGWWCWSVGVQVYLKSVGWGWGQGSLQATWNWQNQFFKDVTLCTEELSCTNRKLTFSNCFKTQSWDTQCLNPVCASYESHYIRSYRDKHQFFRKINTGDLQKTHRAFSNKTYRWMKPCGWKIFHLLHNKKHFLIIFWSCASVSYPKQRARNYTCLCSICMTWNKIKMFY